MPPPVAAANHPPTATTMTTPANVVCGGNGSPRRHNEALSNLFKTLAQWYQECPLLEHDAFRSYTFSVMARRVRHLPYEITKDRLAQLEHNGGKWISTATLQIMSEYLSHGTCSRLDVLKNDKKRRSMRNMMRIWGVGQAKASALVVLSHSPQSLG
jgi:hypothetical protein